MKKGYFDYETMGFGEVTHNEEELVDKICENMYNGCINDEKYIKRAEKFFKYTDKNNCKRVYNWILENWFYLKIESNYCLNIIFKQIQNSSENSMIKLSNLILLFLFIFIVYLFWHVLE